MQLRGGVRDWGGLGPLLFHPGHRKLRSETQREGGTASSRALSAWPHAGHLKQGPLPFSAVEKYQVRNRGSDSADL